jgi:hypothetical protein
MRRETEREIEKNSQYRGKKREFGREGSSINSNLSDAACSCAASTRRFENMTPALCFTQRRNFMIPVLVEGTLQRRYLTPHMVYCIVPAHKGNGFAARLFYWKERESCLGLLRGGSGRVGMSFRHDSKRGSTKTHVFLPRHERRRFCAIGGFRAHTKSSFQGEKDGHVEDEIQQC